MRPRHTLLVVDDEPDVVKSVQDLLRLDYRVLGATSAKDGIQLMQEHEVHIIMTDQRMPEMTGVELLRRLRGEYPEAIRLLFTGYADIKAVIDAINQGNVYRYITKPWDPDELETIIKQAAEHYELLVERKRLLAELQAKNQQLGGANAELQQASALKSAFIQVASHELRTPLTILLGLAELSLRATDVSPALYEWVRRMHAAALRLNHLIDQMMNCLLRGRFERPLERQSTDLTQLLNQAAEDVRPFASLRQQNLTLELDPGLGQACVEGGKIRDCIGHLLLNAIKFTPDGGQIELVARRPVPDKVEIQVIDHGVGIASASQPRVFEPFFTGFDVSRHSTGTFEYNRRGLGLGLTVVKTFIEMHGGEVGVTSTVGKGTTFTVRLPTSAP